MPPAEANRDAAEQCATRARAAASRGELQRAVQLLERAISLYPDAAYDRELRETRMRYARERDARNNAQTPPRDPPRRLLPLPASLERFLAHWLGAHNVQAVCCLMLVLLLMLSLRVVFARPLVALFGQLPGDINISGANFSVHMPIVTCMLISMALQYLGAAWTMRGGGRGGDTAGWGGAGAGATDTNNGGHAEHPGRGGGWTGMLPGRGGHFERGGVHFSGGVFLCNIQ